MERDLYVNERQKIGHYRARSAEEKKKKKKKKKEEEECQIAIFLLHAVRT